MDDERDTPTAPASEVLASWLPEPEAEPLDLDEVVDHLHAIEERVSSEWQACPPPRAPRATMRPRPAADAPSVDELLRSTFDSLPAPALPARALDPMFTSSELYDDMVAAMADSMVPVAMAPAAAGREGEPPPRAASAAPRSERRRPLGFAAVVAACLASFALGVGSTLVVEDRTAAAAAETARATPVEPPHGEALCATEVPAVATSPEPESATEAPAAEAPAAEAPAATEPATDGAAPASTAAGQQATPMATAIATDAATTDGPPAPAADEPSGDTSPAPRAFDQAAAAAAVNAAAAVAASCGDGEHRGRALVTITFAPSGRATSAVVGGSALAGTSVGSCIARAMRGAKVPPFDGPMVTVSKTVHVR